MKHTLLAAALLLLATTACTPTVATRGNLVDPDEMTAITIGKSTKDDVRQALGSPTDEGTLDPNTWYYVGQKTERLGFRREHVTERRVVTVAFDEAGIVKAITPLDNQGREVAMNEDSTPTSGHNLTVMQQIFGNLGKFNDKDANTSDPTGGVYN